MNIAQILERSRRLFPDKPALIFEGQSFTYRELSEMSNRVANGLAGLGIARGDRVAIFLPNTPAFMSVYFGIQKIGAVAVCVNSAYKADETRFILDDSGARVVVTTEELRGNVPAENLPNLKHILIAEDGASFDYASQVQRCSAQDAPRNDRLSALMADASPIAQAVECAPDDPAVILYTMATGGFPKGATLSHNNMVFSARVSAETFRLRRDDCVLLFLPAFYSFAQNAVFLPCFDVGATLVLHREYGSAAILQSIAEQRVTVFFGVPTIYTILLNKASAEQMRSVRFYNSAAAPLPLDVASRWRTRLDLDITDHYGMTETSMVSFNHLRQLKPGAIGTPVEGVEMQVVDERGHQVKTGQVGEIVVRGPNVMLGYWNRPAETNEAKREGWFHTGDLGRVDDDGYFYFTGHIKDMVNVGGQKVYAAEVERVLREHPAVAQVAVYGVPDAVMCEQVRACIVLRPDAQITAEEIIAFCEQRLADFKAPKGVELVDAFPAAETHRMLKEILRERYQANAPTSGALSPQAKTLSREAIQNWIVEWLCRKLALDPETIEIHRPLVDYGWKSLMAVNFALDLSRWSGRSISPLITWNYPTVEALTRHLENGRPMQKPVFSELPNEIREKTAENGFLRQPTRTSDLGALSDEELVRLLADEIELARSKTR
jgi:long-chain acyl-CoA synthetase